MADITASMVKELRERTQAGMADCKNALKEADGDMAKAVEILQKKGILKGMSKQGKIAAEGAVSAAVSGNVGVALEFNCQTDFVARGDEFKGMLRELTNAALAHKPADVATLEAVSVEGRTFAERINDLTARSGEKHALRRVAVYEAGEGSLLHTYVHSNHRIAVLVELVSSNVGHEAVKEFAEDVALQIASMSPKYLLKSEVPTETVDKQREIFSAQMDQEDAAILAEPDAYLERVRLKVIEDAREAGTEVADPAAEAQRLVTEDAKFKASLEGFVRAADKLKARPAAVRAKILEGKVSKWLTEVVLVDQTSVKESDKTIAKIQSEVAARVPGTAVKRFVRFEVGEGIEKGPAKDFATEVAEMAAQAG
ncbi:MAG: elongation factor Ts [Myxococcales bacterium]|nr:elongation factor Ts [Myxococcales bacterium]